MKTTRHNMRPTWLILIYVLCLAACHQRHEVGYVSGTRHEIGAALDSAPHALATEYLTRFQEEVRRMQAPVLGASKQYMEAGRPESLLSNLTADILREASLKYGGTIADVGIMNMGGLRSSLPEGNITVGDVYKVFPFENKLFTLTLTGEQLLDLFGRFAAVGGQGISGAEIVIGQANGQPCLAQATVAGKPIRKDKTYRIATIDYLAEGNDGMSTLRDGTERRLFDTLTLRQVVTNYIVEQTKQGNMIESRLEGRIKSLTAGIATKTDKKESPIATKTTTSAPSEELAENKSLSTNSNTRSDVCSPLSLVEPGGRGPRLTILHTSDTHSCIEPDSKTGLGGYVRRATFVEQVRKDNSKALLVDCGDFSQGSLYYNLFKGAAEVVMMNVIGYDVATIGNHEFDFGLDNMMRIFAMAEFPIVSTNYDFTGTVVEAFVRPYHVIKVDGVRVGFVGVGPQLEGLVAEANCKGVKYRDPIVAADSVAAILKEQERCDVVVCLSHLGWKTGNGVDDEHLIAGTRHLDLVLGGHTHSYFKEPLYYKNLEGRDIMLMHVGKNGQYVSETVIGF